MIYLILLVILAATYQYRRWRASRRAARDMARRFVSRDPAIRFLPMKSSAEFISRCREERDVYETAQERRRLARVRRLHQLNNPELYA